MYQAAREITVGVTTLAATIGTSSARNFSNTTVPRETGAESNTSIRSVSTSSAIDPAAV